MDIEGLNIGLGITGSFCTFEKLIPQVEKLVQSKANVYPIFSTNAAAMDTRFGKAADWINRFEKITGHEAISTIADAEPIGPKGLIDILVIAPCTGNTSQIQNYIYFILICLNGLHKAIADFLEDRRLQCSNPDPELSKIPFIVCFFFCCKSETALLKPFLFQ